MPSGDQSGRWPSYCRARISSCGRSRLSSRRRCRRRPGTGRTAVPPASAHEQLAVVSGPPHRIPAPGTGARRSRDPEPSVANSVTVSSAGDAVVRGDAAIRRATRRTAPRPISGSVSRRTARAVGVDEPQLLRAVRLTGEDRRGRPGARTAGTSRRRRVRPGTDAAMSAVRVHRVQVAAGAVDDDAVRRRTERASGTRRLGADEQRRTAAAARSTRPTRRSERSEAARRRGHAAVS